jgi:hypothetical protein
MIHTLPSARIKPIATITTSKVCISPHPTLSKRQFHQSLAPRNRGVLVKDTRDAEFFTEKILNHFAKDIIIPPVLVG